jgi:hypothetical protein
MANIKTEISPERIENGYESSRLRGKMIRSDSVDSQQNIYLM